ncbi:MULTISPECIES: chorismate mutase [Prochlorococcus]|uniref:chorismate mutase n=1 Tax=Prochlorococcus TaxID=1218 RepID=UPI000533A2FB|nr:MULTISPECIES: chorismate mutase [Prochlorococcus]KGG12062.1 Chorismate mutase II [Prochlorococcus sp. MIT 0601]
MKLQALRGATTSPKNSIESIEKAVSELVSELVTRNRLDASQIVSITFSVTRDLDACFPASIARRQPGWEKIALLDCQQMFVKGDLEKCIRILAHVWIPENQEPHHTYLGRASKLRPDM